MRRRKRSAKAGDSPEEADEKVVGKAKDVKTFSKEESTHTKERSRKRQSRSSKLRI